MRSAWPVLLTMLSIACTDDTEDTAPTCDQECADYFLARSVSSVHSKIWTTVLSQEFSPYKQIKIPCIEGVAIADGMASKDKKTGGYELDITMDFDGCKQSDPNEGGGYELTLTGIVDWEGSWSSNGQEQNFNYQSSELTFVGEVYTELVPTEVDDACTVQVNLNAQTTEVFTFAGNVCSRGIVDPSVEE